jgi:guanylate kinase
MYGTSKMTIEEQSAKGRVVVLDIEMEGVKQVKQAGLPMRYVFIAPPNDQELERRLRARGTETEASIQQRLARARDELAFAETAGFDKVITNDDLETAYRALEEWVYAPAN